MELDDDADDVAEFKKGPEGSASSKNSKDVDASSQKKHSKGPSQTSSLKR